MSGNAESSDTMYGLGWTGPEVRRFIQECYDRDTILHALLGYSARYFGGRFALIVGRSWLQVFDAIDWPDLHADIEPKKCRASFSEGARAVTESPATGTPANLGLDGVLTSLKLTAKELSTVGLPIGPRIAIVLGGVCLDGIDDMSDLNELAKVAGAQLETVIRMAKEGELPPPEERIPSRPSRVSEIPAISRAAKPALEENSGSTLNAPGLKIEPQDDNPATQPGMRKQASDDGDLNDWAAEDVDVVPPLNLAPEQANRTQLGGRAADDAFLGALADTSSPVGLDKTSSNASGTQIGGLAAAELPKPEPKPEEVIAKPAAEQASAEPTESAESKPKSKKGMPPGMMIMRTSKKLRGKGKPKPEAAEPAPAPAPEPDIDIDASSDPPALDDEASPATVIGRPVTSADLGSDIDDLFDLGSSSGADASSGAASTSGDIGSEPVDDAPEASDPGASSGDVGSDPIEDVPESEPQPEAPAVEATAAPSEPSEPRDLGNPVSRAEDHLEQFLGSSPSSVDVQENFLMLDSRNRSKAFTAADQVAAESGEAAVEVLAKLFPGRIFVDRYQYTSADMPPAEEHSPILRALVRIGDAALAVAMAHMGDSSNENRFYAMLLLGELEAEMGLYSLFPRLFDKDTQVRELATELAYKYRETETFETAILSRLHDEVRAHKDDAHVDTAAAFLGRLHDVSSVGLLIDALGELKPGRAKQSVKNALHRITLHDHSSPYEWKHWWEEANGQTREDWIVAAMNSTSATSRQFAFEEVLRVPGLEINYHPDQPSKLRKRAQEELRAWFAAKK